MVGGLQEAEGFFVLSRHPTSSSSPQIARTVRMLHWRGLVQNYRSQNSSLSSFPRLFGQATPRT